jgi:transposase InsO family protein
MNIKKICAFFGYSRQAYYKSLNCVEKEDHTGLLKYVTQRRRELPFEGIRKLYCHISRDTEFIISRSQLGYLMLQNGLIINRKKSYRYLTNSRHGNSVAENYLQRNKPGHVFEVLVSDITYLRTKNKEYYLTAIMDLYSRMILSYCLTNQLSSDGLIRAFLLIAREYKEDLRGSIFHSDRGTQYCSNAFRELAEKHEVRLSNSRNGNPYDNACMERLFSTLKNEYMLKITFPDLECLNRALKNAVSSYNNTRLHMGLGNQTPKEFFIASLKSYEHINKERKSSKKKETLIIN